MKILFKGIRGRGIHIDLGDAMHIDLGIDLGDNLGDATLLNTV